MLAAINRCLGSNILNFFSKIGKDISIRPNLIDSKTVQLKNIRFYLSPAYNCEKKWNGRKEDPFIKDTKPGEFYYGLIKKYKNTGKLSAIDADIFVNSVTGSHALEVVDEMEEVLRFLRRSPETINTLPSTTHAVIRILMEIRKYDLILRLLADPMNYGVFLDFYSANLLMDTFIKEKNYMAAARVASSLMLQEDFGPPLTKALVLLCCFEYVFIHDENEPWVDFNPVVEPEEEVKVVVSYIRNPFFDDHFDLKNPTHIVGKTLAWLSFHLEQPLLKSNSELLGWSLYEKWDELNASLKRIAQDKLEVAEDVFSKVTHQIELCQDEEVKSKLSLFLSDISKANLVSEHALMPKVKGNVVECVTKFEGETIAEQNNAYDEWIEKRKKEVKQQLDMYERKKFLEEIKAKKDDLQRREDVIFFFDNKDKFEMLLAKKEQEELNQEEKLRKFGHVKKKKEEDEYIPPEV